MAADRRAHLLLHLDSSRADEVAAIADLEAILDAQLAAARAAWPAVQLGDDAYLEHLADKLCERADEPAARVLAQLPAADLFLAAACAAGDVLAIAAFRSALLPSLRPVLGKLGASPAMVDDIEQRILVMLFVADGRRAQIATYGGRGSLRSWLRSIGVRTARRTLGAAERGIGAPGAAADDLELHQLATAAHDPQLATLRERYGAQVRAAFAAALAGLTGRERNMLRQYHLDGMTIDDLAALYRVNRGTTARWVIAARSAVLDATRARLTSELGIETSDVDSIIRLVRSQLDVSLRDLNSPNT